MSSWADERVILRRFTGRQLVNFGIFADQPEDDAL
jgi:hypothetical protein